MRNTCSTWTLHLSLISATKDFPHSVFSESLQESAVIPSQADLSFTVLLLNADSAGNPLEHFSAEEAGQTI